MKKFIVLFASILTLWVSSYAQVVEVVAATNKILQESYPGFRTEIKADLGDVENMVKIFLRDIGKMRERNSYFQITEATIDGQYFGERSFFAVIKSGREVQNVWFGANLADLTNEDKEQIDKLLEQMTYQFAVDFYKSRIQMEIDESEQAAQYTERKYRKLERDGVDLKNKLEANEKELVRLQEAIQANKLEHEVLLLKIDENKLTADSTVVDLEKIRKVIEMQKSKKEAVH
ncbi:MAG: hypothetical protein OEX02_00350 [Cyclobacteriaceae bacterium]|nr:hypothetical protein [Cyclobacteriaceae bacterium]